MHLVKLSPVLWLFAGIAFVVAGLLQRPVQLTFFAVAFLFFVLAILSFVSLRRRRQDSGR